MASAVRVLVTLRRMTASASTVADVEPLTTAFPTKDPVRVARIVASRVADATAGLPTTASAGRLPDPGWAIAALVGKSKKYGSAFQASMLKKPAFPDLMKASTSRRPDRKALTVKVADFHAAAVNDPAWLPKTTASIEDEAPGCPRRTANRLKAVPLCCRAMTASAVLEEALVRRRMASAVRLEAHAPRRTASARSDPD